MERTINITPIERTPNIGTALAAELRGVGIDSLEALMSISSSSTSGGRRKAGMFVRM